ncbi:hypothetical protein RCL1_000376 [Eukaryota sp. TZLM3-RCL]
MQPLVKMQNAGNPIQYSSLHPVFPNAMNRELDALEYVTGSVFNNLAETSVPEVIPPDIHSSHVDLQVAVAQIDSIVGATLLVIHD